MGTIQKQTGEKLKEEREAFEGLKNGLTVLGVIMLFVGLIPLFLAAFLPMAIRAGLKGVSMFEILLPLLLGVASEAILPSVIIARCYSSKRENDKTPRQNFKTGFWVSMLVFMLLSALIIFLSTQH